MRGKCRQMYHSCRLVNKRRFGSILLLDWWHYWRSVHSPTGINIYIYIVYVHKLIMCTPELLVSVNHQFMPTVHFTKSRRAASKEAHSSKQKYSWNANPKGQMSTICNSLVRLSLPLHWHWMIMDQRAIRTMKRDIKTTFSYTEVILINVSNESCSQAV